MPSPGLYREVRPAWSDENLRYLCRHIRSHLYFAHVRASTGTPITRPNCHPFACGRWMFMHNGLIGNWSRLRRKVEALIPERFYGSRIGTTDFGSGVPRHPRRRRRQGPDRRNRARARDPDRHGEHQGYKEPLRFTAALANGQDLYAFRYSANDKANSLYYRESGGNVVIVSEPLDTERAHWKPVPPGHMVVAQGRQAGRGSSRFPPGRRVAAE